MDRPMTASEIDQAACARYELYTRKNRRALCFERNIRFFVEYLVDTRAAGNVMPEGRSAVQPSQGLDPLPVSDRKR